MEQPEKKYSVKFKRSRSSRACEVCHSRKVRCDATIHIPCTNCLTFGCECRMPQPKERKNSKKTTIQNPDGSTTTTAATPAPTVRRKHEPLAAISGRTAKIDNQKLLRKQSNLVSFVGSSSAASLITLDESNDINQTNSHFTLDDWVPSTIKNSINKTRTNLDTVQLEILRLRGAFLLPEKALCDELVYDFFEHVYPLEPLINKEKFLKQYEEESMSLLLLQAILLAASRVSTSPLILDSDDSTYLASCTFYQRAKALYDANYEDDPVAVVQSLILFSKFWEGIDEVLGNSFYWIRVAITAAQGYGFHRDLVNSKFSEEQRHMAKMLWWHLYIRDMSVAVAYGRPKSILLEDCDVKMLTADDLPSDLSREDAEVFVQMIKLTEIISIVNQEQYSVHAEKMRQRNALATNHCDMIMSSWRNNLPSSLQYSPHQNSSLSVNILNLHYYSTVILVHRSNMVKTTHLNGKQYPSEGIVFRASRIIADISQKMIKKKEFKYTQATIIPVLFNASLTFVCHMDSKNTAIAKSAKDGYAICHEALKEMGSFYLIAIFIYNSLEKFAKDSNARCKLVRSLAKRNDPHHANGNVPNIIPSNTTGYPLPNQQQPPHQPNQPQQPVFQQQPQQYASPVVQQNFVPSNQVRQQPQLPQQSQSRPNQPPQQPQPQPQPQQIAIPPQPDRSEVLSNNIGFSQNDSIEFPDLYLFTNNLPSSTENHNFDPSQLFPSKENISGAPSEGSTSDILNSNEFNLNLPEFEFQNLGDSLSIHNLSSLNTYLDQGNNDISGVTADQTQQHNAGPQPRVKRSDSQGSNIYNFVN